MTNNKRMYLYNTCKCFTYFEMSGLFKGFIQFCKNIYINKGNYWLLRDFVVLYTPEITTCLP